MIVTCNKCSTRFNLDDFLVKEDGSKVRCSVCKDIFTVYPPVLESEPEIEEPAGLGLESDMDDGDAFEESSDFEMEDSDLSIKDSDLEIQGADLEIEDTSLDPEVSDLDVDDDFSFDDSEFAIDENDEFQDIESEENRLELEDDGIGFEDASEDDFDGIEFESIDDEPGSLDFQGIGPALEMEDETQSRISEESIAKDSSADEDEFELEFDVDDDSEDETPDILDDAVEEISLEMETEPDTEDADLLLDKSKTEEEPPVITPEEDFSEYDEVLEQETEPQEELLEEETIEIEDTQEKDSVQKPEPIIDTSPRSRRRKKKPLIGAPVLVLLLIVFLVVGAYIASIMTGYKIPYLSDIKIPFIEQLLKKAVPETSEAKPVPNQKSVNGRFVTNATAGTLFVITGRVENPSNIALSHIEIIGALITKGKVEAKTKNSFCGNIITEEMLKTENILDINKLLEIKEGSHNSNVNIKPGASVPFMIVFSDLPEKLQNFTVKVANFEKANIGQ
ncbi:MAG: zinc-ribbon domain-containing protein [Proteobacteria bacterium]|nr:zinc-ribbon domain-containing protein [Pseudomonadota bacterium]MBU1583032.1 zinc-ribbon domain-containing protein [Pseudomonadota bacterium]MBU2453411.1 zinc-ribbon domain-containing protein [Pseudomonadota bacterium]